MGTDNYDRLNPPFRAAPVSEGKYRAKLRLIETTRVENNEAETEYFYMDEDEEIIDVTWFSQDVLVTLAKVEWSKKYPQSPESTQGTLTSLDGNPCGPNCVVTPETAHCHGVDDGS